MSHKSEIKDIPIFINVRDRLSCLLELLGWLDRGGYHNITLIDNASSYIPLVSFLEKCSYNVVRSSRNLGNAALWQINELKEVLENTWFVYSDPDVVPIEACPYDLIDRLYDILHRFPYYIKAGPGLYLEDIPDHYHLKQQVIDLETPLYGREVAPGVFQANVDTTFALHRPHAPYILGPALRLRGNYQVRHLPWYVNSDNPDDEEIYYRCHAARSVTNWNTASDVRLQHSTISGGMAFELESDPVSLLGELLKTRSGRVFSIIRFLKRLCVFNFAEMRTPRPKSTDEARQQVLDILLSDEWMKASNTIRRIKTCTKRFS